MRNTVYVLVILFLALSSCKRHEQPKVELSGAPVVTYNYVVSGMTCTGCEETIQSAVSKIEGIKSVKASHEKGEAIVELNPGIADTAEVNSAIRSTGYLVLGITEVK